MRVLLLLLWAATGAAHVPAFGSRACPAPLVVGDPRTSQVRYFQTVGTDGVVVPAAGNHGLALQIGLRDRAALGELEAFVGCLPPNVTAARMCTGPLPASTPLVPRPPKLEAFTQTVHHVVVEVRGEACASAYGIFLRSARGRPVRWSAVVGEGERFTLEQLLLFPAYMARAHGAFGNDRYRLHVLAGFVTLHVLVALGLLALARSDLLLRSADRTDRVLRNASMLSALAAGTAFYVVCLDKTLHFVDSAHEAGSDETLAAARLFVPLVAVTANLLPLGAAVWLVGHHVRGSAHGPHVLPACVGLGLLVAACAAALCALGDATVVGVVCASLGAALVGAGLLARRARTKALPVALVLLTCWAWLLLAFLGAGYWVGPSLLVLAGACALAHEARPATVLG